MNYTRQTFRNRGRHNEPEKRFHLALRKTRVERRERVSCKENDSAIANTDLDIYNYRNIGLCNSDTSSTDSQNYNLRLSESIAASSGKRMPCYYKSNDSKYTASTKSNTTVSISDSNSSGGGSNDNSPCMKGLKKSSTVYPTPFYRDTDRNRDLQPVDTILIESSDSDNDVFNTNKECAGMISLDSDDDSLLKTLKMDSYNKSVDKVDTSDRLKRGNREARMKDNMSFESASESSGRNKSRTTKRDDKCSGKIDIPGNYESSNSSGRSSSTHFSPNLNGSSKHKVISESSSNEETQDTGLVKGDGIVSLDLIERRRNESYSNRNNSRLNLNNLTSREKNFANITTRSNSKCLATSNLYDSVKLTKKDAERIFKGVKVSGNPLWTPKLDVPYLKYESDSLSSYSQAIKNKLMNEKVINETASELLMSDSNSDDGIIRNSPPNVKPVKTHVSRFINTPNQEQQYANLSDRKKTEISNWLMNNTPGSSSSSSIISESNRNSSFGNSSLERFELKHETPNNRGRISKPSTTEKPNSVQSMIDRFIYKGKTSALKNQIPPTEYGSLEKIKPYPIDVTPKYRPTIRREKTPKDPKKNNIPVVKTVQNLEMEDCADILDKLYGNVWRNKADAVFTPRTEPRPQKNVINKKNSNTERKYTSKPVQGNKQTFSSSEENEFDAFTKCIKPNFNSTKKKPSRDSFIDDKSTSENSSESFYHTALTNPRESQDHRQPNPVPVSVTTVRTLSICDSESDLDENYPTVSDKDLNRKRLSFSEDGSNSSTSEFDPGEVVPPKPRAKKASTKIVRQKQKPTNGLLSSEQSICEQFKSFLASLSASVPISNCHPKARIYRNDYKNKKEELCRYLFKLYNKEIFDEKLPNDMVIEWNVRMRGTAGFCYNKKSVTTLRGVVRSSRIVLATKILDTPDRLRDTLIHEMCHAAAWLINNVSDGHGPFWKGWASRAIKTFPELPPIKRCHDYKIKTKYTYRCTKCGYSIGRHSKSLDIERKRCGHCYGKFELFINRTTRSGTAQVATPVQSRTPNGFALFVKENYHTVKKDRRSIKHAEVMKILGQQFSAIKIGKKPIDNICT